MDDGMTKIESAGQGLDEAPLGCGGDVRMDLRFATVIALLGFTSFWTVVIVVIAGGSFGSTGYGLFFDNVLRFFLLLGFALIQFLSYTCLIDRLVDSGPRFFVRLMMVVSLGAFVSVGLCVGMGVAVPISVACLVWLIFGVACGLFVVSWGTVWSMIDSGRPDSRTSSLAIAGSLVFAVGLALLLMFVPVVVSIVAVACLFVLSLYLQAFCMSQFPEPEKIDWKTSQNRLKLFSRNLITPGFAGLTLGASLAFCVILLDTETSVAVSIIGMGVGSLAVFLVLAGRRSVPRASSVERITFPIFGGALIVIPFTEGVLQAIVLTLLVAAATGYFVFHWSILMALSYRHHVQTTFHYAQGLIAPTVGTVLGWAAVIGFVQYAPISSNGAVCAVAFAIVFLLIIDLAIVPYASNRMVESMFDPLVDEGPEPSRVATWKTRCGEICIEYHLTPREQEVFALLAKGRNAEHIGKEYFISTHTVKTHTSRIYRKLSINSQQELIDLVDERRTR